MLGDLQFWEKFLNFFNSVKFRNCQKIESYCYMLFWNIPIKIRHWKISISTRLVFAGASYTISKCIKNNRFCQTIVEVLHAFSILLMSSFINNFLHNIICLFMKSIWSNKYLHDLWRQLFVSHCCSSNCLDPNTKRSHSSNSTDSFSQTNQSVVSYFFYRNILLVFRLNYTSIVSKLRVFYYEWMFLVGKGGLKSQWISSAVGFFSEQQRSHCSDRLAIHGELRQNFYRYRSATDAGVLVWQWSGGMH